jgi:hypothetical protein
MKNLIVGSVIAFAAGLLIPQTLWSQGVTYISSLDLPSSSMAAIGSDSSLATAFSTGSNVGGYSLDSVQLAMASGSGDPGGFTVALYSEGGCCGRRPRNQPRHSYR